LLRKECLEVSGVFKEEKSFSDIDFIINLAFYFNAVILYEPLVFRRLHQSNYITHNWEKSYHEGIEVVKSNKERLPSTIANHRLFIIYMNFGEKYLSYNFKGKAIKCFLRGWKYKPFSIVPIKKSIKAALFF
jgi:hypothetical protein